ncbi:glutathione S-transferase T2-like [Arachis stenosperma]|uniref:glutathione S-transferase T2-like n=1 Tax=Arachis stenosperma TaxID=217475 RepID=UPI0025AD929A|nr:glutathione S-transferase T2-like [Arachis stenosperma]
MDPNQLNSFFNYLQNFPQIPNTQQSQTSNSQVPNQNFILPNTFQNPNPQNLSNFNFQTPYNNQFPIFQLQNQNSQTPHLPFLSIFNPSIGNVTPTSLPFPTQFSASRHNSSGVGGSSNPSSQTPIQSSPNSQYSDFANPHGLDAIDLNDDIEDRRQDSIQHWHWKEDEMLISAWLNISTDPGVVACKKRWYKINKAVAQFAGCYDQASRNIRSGSNADDIKELAYKLYSTNYGQKFTFERHWNMLRLEQKWRSQLPTQSGGSKRTKVSATGAYSSSSNPETPLADEPGVDSPVRPQGSKKSKRRGK